MEKPVIPRWNGSVLKQLLEKHDWTPEDMAAVIGANKSQVFKWQEDETTPGARYLAAMAVALNVTMETFIIGVESYRSFAMKFIPKGRKRHRRPDVNEINQEQADLLARELEGKVEGAAVKRALPEPGAKRLRRAKRRP